LAVKGHTIGKPDNRGTSRRGFIKGGIGATVGVLVSQGADASPPESAAEPAVQASEAATTAGLDSVPVETTVNGKAHTLLVYEDESALSVVRDRLGLTGAKEGCGHGRCGACSCKLDGEVVATCLLPASSLHGRELQTIESLATDLGGELHPVQKAFLAEDALQCGFCTPGFIMAATDFYDRWRAEHGDTEPSREQVAHALVGHLCRCGAYPAIYRAVRGACAGRFEGAAPTPERHDALEKVRGEATYTVDVKRDGLLEARTVRSPHAHARVKGIDTTAAMAFSGVKGVHVLTEVGGLVRYSGQEIVAIAATDRWTAERARRLVNVDYEVLTPTVGMKQARDPESVAVYPGPPRRPPFSNEGVEVPAPWKHNLRGPFSFHVQAGKARRTVQASRDEGSNGLVDGSWHTHVQCHSSLEPHACVAEWNGDDKLKVWVSTQSCTDMAEDIAKRWCLKRRNVHVQCQYIGGGFGAKATLGIEMVAAIELAKACKAPVRMALDRSEELSTGGIRPGAQVDLAMAAGKDGGLEAVDITAYNDAGVAIGSNVGIFFRLMYPGCPKAITDFDVVSHAPPGKPFRGPGGPAAFLAMESSVDAMALQLGEDPIALRRRWDVHKIRHKLYDWAEKVPMWQERGPVAADKGRFRRGVGLAASTWFHFAQSNIQVQVSSDSDGVTVSCAAQDMGNGTRTSMAAGVAEVLGIPRSEVEVQVGDSRLLHGPLSAGSRTTTTLVPATKEATSRLAKALVEHARKSMGLEDARAAEGGVAHSGGKVSWNEVLRSAPPMSFTGRRKADKGGWYLPFALNAIQIGRALTAAVSIIEVEVDSRLGKVTPRQVSYGIAAGRIVVPRLAASQIEGGVIQGLSYALLEDRRLDPRNGRLISRNLEDYRIAGLGDAPEIDIHFEESGFEHVRERILGLSELSTVGIAATLCNAVHHATGWRPRELPLRTERVLKGLAG